MKIKKVSGTSILNGNVIDSLEDNSSTNAPSQRAVNEVLNKRRQWEYQLTTKSSSTNAWSEIANTFTTDVIPAGKYMIQFIASYVGTANGMATINPVLDGTRLSDITRSTVPIVHNLYSTAQSTIYIEFTTDSTHKVNIQIYSNASGSASSARVIFIRID